LNYGIIFLPHIHPAYFQPIIFIVFLIIAIFVWEFQPMVTLHYWSIYVNFKINSQVYLKAIPKNSFLFYHWLISSVQSCLHPRHFKYYHLLNLFTKYIISFSDACHCLMLFKLYSHYSYHKSFFLFFPAHFLIFYINLYREKILQLCHWYILSFFHYLLKYLIHYPLYVSYHTFTVIILLIFKWKFFWSGDSSNHFIKAQ
jgi:hypothetical protein